MSTIATTPSPVITALDEIETLAKAYANARQLVSLRVDSYNNEVRALNARRMPGLKSSVAEAADAQAKLVAAIQAHPELFEKPRTMTLHGIKLGFQKGKGTIDWADDDKLALKIQALLPDQFETLVKISYKPLAGGLKNLDVGTLRKLGCTVEETGDAVFVKASDSGVDKLVARILKEGAVEEAAA